MCTLTYFPKEEGYIITANRDESALRSAGELSAYNSSSAEMYYIAREPMHGGSNLAVGIEGRVTVLLNGAFAPHDRTKNWGLSRGIVLLKSLDFTSLFAFSDHFDFTGIEPFTQVNFTGTLIEELRWDGTTIHRRSHPGNKPLLWASAQLYSPEVLKKRQEWLQQLIASGATGAKEIANFHLHGGEGDPQNDMVMNRNGLVQTVSVTQVAVAKGSEVIHHWDLLRNKHQLITV